jgi:hypothetical protein
LRRLDLNDINCTEPLDRIYAQIRGWARYVKLDPNPKLPRELRNRDADNWRPLIAIADSFGTGWGKIARMAAVFFAQGPREEDVVVMLLRDIRRVFDARGLDRITGKALLVTLHELEDTDWSEFHGIKGDAGPHKLRASELRAMLRSLSIGTRSVWPRKGAPEDRSAKGYFRSDFEPAWRAYLDDEEGAETGKSAKVIALRPPEGA